VLLLGILAALIATLPALGTPPSIDAKRAEAQRVLGEIHALDASLGAANERLNLANLRLANVQADIKESKYELRIANRNLERSRRTIAKRLVTLYTSGETSTLEVILGSRSLLEVISRIDTEDRISELDADIIDQVKTYKLTIKRHQRQLARRQVQVRQLVAERQARKNEIEASLGERNRLLSSLNGEIQRLIAAQQGREAASARAARERVLAAQSRQPQSTYDTVVGATAATPEGATVVPR
jgi:peptidoglycan hydrolase CwlO-like protein